MICARTRICQHASRMRKVYVASPSPDPLHSTSHAYYSLWAARNAACVCMCTCKLWKHLPLPGRAAASTAAAAAAAAATCHNCFVRTMCENRMRERAAAGVHMSACAPASLHNTSTRESFLAVAEQRTSLVVVGAGAGAEGGVGGGGVGWWVSPTVR